MLDKLAGDAAHHLSGGEPMQYKYFWDALEHALGKFELIVLSTNASMITRDAAARLMDLVSYVDVTAASGEARAGRAWGGVLQRDLTITKSLDVLQQVD
jgi:MoaA/NifB/PqqE/SkfB family radical SAM enzyme